MSLYCSGECCAHGEKDFISGGRDSRPADADDLKSGRHSRIEHLVDGLADPMRVAAASRVGSDASDIQIGFRC